MNIFFEKWRSGESSEFVLDGRMFPEKRLCPTKFGFTLNGHQNSCRRLFPNFDRSGRQSHFFQPPSSIWLCCRLRSGWFLSRSEIDPRGSCRQFWSFRSELPGWRYELFPRPNSEPIWPSCRTPNGRFCTSSIAMAGEWNRKIVSLKLPNATINAAA